MTTIVWPVVSSVLSTLVMGGITALYRAIKSTHTRLDKVDQHLRNQDLKIAKIEGKLGT